MSGLRCSSSFCEAGDVYCEPAWWIGLRSSGSHGGSPKGTRKRVRLDVEAVGRQAKVQTGRENVSDWMLKLRESQRKSNKQKYEIKRAMSKLTSP